MTTVNPSSLASRKELAEAARRYLKAIESSRFSAKASAVSSTHYDATATVPDDGPALPVVQPAAECRSFPAGSLRLSFVIVIHNERAAVMDLYTRIALASASRDLRFEIIFVDKGSKDGSWEEISRLCYGDSRLHGTRVRPDTNEAQSLACGIRVSSGDLLFTLNAGYDDASQISRFMAKMDEGYDYVCGVTSSERGMGFARAFMDWAGRLTGFQFGDFRTGYKCYNGRMIRNVSRMLKLKDYDARMACTSRVHGCRSAEIVVEPLKPLAGLGKRPVKNPVLLHLRKYAVPYLLVPSVVMLILAVAMVTANGGLSAPSLVSLQVAIASALAALYASGFSVAALLARLALPARFIHKPQLVSALVAAKAKEPVTASARMAARLKCVSTVSLGVPTIMTTMTAQPVPVRADQWVFPDHLMPQRRAASTCSVARIAASQENASPSVVNGGTTVLPKVTPNEQLKQLVLIADDDAAIRHVMRIHMEMNGFRVIEAASGSQVLTELDNKPDLILLDLMMPGGLNGEECLREIQKRSPGVRVIVVSGRIDVEESKSEINAFEFIAKPVDFSTLITAVNRAFHRPTAATV